jgi:N-acylneuraminate cytidylyltransferase
VRAVLDRHAAGDVGSTLTGCAVGHHPLKQLLVDDAGTASPVRTWADLEAPRQQLPRALRPNGAVYVTAAGAMAAAGAVLVPPLAVVEMPEERSLDVDTAADLATARARLEG